MPATITIDAFEQYDMDHYFRRYGLTVVRQNMVHLGLGDLLWVDRDGRRITLEHKSIDQVVAEMGGRLDQQLLKHQQAADISGLIIDGLLTPASDGGSRLWKPSKDNRFFIRHRKLKQPYDAVAAYLWSLQARGFIVQRYETLEALCYGVAAMVFNSLKSGHRPLTVFMKPQLPASTAADDPQANYIRTLMGIGGALIGEKTARKILAQYPTPWDFFLAGSSAEAHLPRDLILRVAKGLGRRVL